MLPPRPEQRQQVIHTELHVLHFLSTQRRFCEFTFLLLQLPGRRSVTAYNNWRIAYLKDPLLDSLRNSELENIDVTGLPETMGAIECLVLSQRSILNSKTLCLEQTSRAGFHHMSTRITLLQQVKFRPREHTDERLVVHDESDRT